MLRLGPARLAQFLIRHSHGQWRHDKADHLLAVARGTLQLWDGEGIDFDQLGADLAIEADQALMLSAQVRRLDERITGLYAAVDPAQIARTAPGVGPVLAAAITARLGDPHRFTSLAAIRSGSRSTWTPPTPAAPWCSPPAARTTWTRRAPTGTC